MALRLVKDPISSQSNNATSENLIADAHSAGILNGIPASMMKMNIPDVEVLDQDGNRVHFYRDLTKDKTVVINFCLHHVYDNLPSAGRDFCPGAERLG